MSSADMSALVFEGPGRMRVCRRARPDPNPDQVVVAVTAAGICGSELTSFTGDSTRRPPGRIFGHEFVGRVLRSGLHVDRSLADQLVAVNPLRSCGHCAQCGAGRPNVCPDRVLLGLHVDGGFAEEVAVAAPSVWSLAGLDELTGTLAEPLANGVHAVGLLGNVVGKRIAVYGAGAIGLCVIAVLRLAGAGSIVAIDPVPTRREQAIRAGAHEALPPVVDQGSEPSIDDAIDAAGSASSRRAAIEAAPFGAKVVLLGMHHADSELSINLAITKELALLCSYAYVPHEFQTALGLLQSGSVPHADWVTEYPLDQGQRAFETLVEHPEAATKIILRP